MARQRGEKWSACQPFCIAGARARVSAVVVVIVFAEFYSRRRESQTPVAVAAGRKPLHKTLFGRTSTAARGNMARKGGAKK
ncbi:hypothetical protein, unlikely [Trypanosoma brucei gambiense DAL972]|uniref:Uncharacterized protein n=2 Tax=Trypanosoma brucei TaxID=5691 RepID=C9ZIL2_TRYB9|nr:hypothetical protein, unlikely [Trypanosoma brucei gambiense DAL972]RHW74293.1 hypothetical protein DPX39_010030700 [Trypanosoma brucei equiperdum]CBH09004.1 hypothetical protein, unlikely [Trypanosoma brucei gambiense DAL972]|eukprot:XP_011771445.1 hypothetical protein, unlikely [Trypanosoma brucei gambiense DAL972]